MSDLPAPPKDRKERCTLALANPVFFGEWYVRPYDAAWRSGGPLPRFSREMLAFATAHRRGVIVLPPEFLKTTLISQVLPLWLTVRSRVLKRQLRGMLFSEEEGMAQRNLAVVAWHILNNEQLRADFSDSTGRPLLYPSRTEDVWRDDAIIIERDFPSKDPTWQAKGLDSKGIQGRRLDWLIGDDVITPRSAFSPAMRKKAIELWDMQVTTRIVDDGIVMIAGNFNDSRDMLSTLRQRGSYKSFVRPASHAPGNPAQGMDPEKPDAVPTWPENWSLKRLIREKEEKPKRFARIFLLDPRAEEGDVLQVGWMKLIPENELEQHTPLRYAEYLIALDPAPGGETADVEDLDFFNITVGAMHQQPKPTLDIIESIDMRDTITEQVEMVGAIHDRYQRMGRGVIAIVASRATMDAYLRGALVIHRPDLARKIHGISVQGKKEERLQGLGTFAKTGYVRVWEPIWFGLTSSEQDQHQELSLVEEWKDFPFATHDDRLDGLDLAIRGSTDPDIMFGGDEEYAITVL